LNDSHTASRGGRADFGEHHRPLQPDQQHPSGRRWLVQPVCGRGRGRGPSNGQYAYGGLSVYPRAFADEPGSDQPETEYCAVLPPSPSLCWWWECRQCRRRSSPRCARWTQRWCTVCQSPSFVLPVEGAPLVFSSRYAHDMVLQFPGNTARTVEIEANADPERGGYVLEGPVDNAALPGGWCHWETARRLGVRSIPGARPSICNALMPPSGPLFRRRRTH